MSVESLGGGRHEDADRAPQRRQHLGPVHDLGEVRRADLLLALGDEHEVDGRRAAGAANRVECREKRRFGPLLVHGPSADHGLSETGLVDERGDPGRRGPLGRVRLLHVVHEVEAQRARRAGVERREDAGLAVGRYFGDLPESGVAQQPHRELAPLVHAAVLGRDRRLADPFLQALHRLVVTLFDLGEHGREIIAVSDRRAARQGECHRSGRRVLEESSAIHKRPPTRLVYRRDAGIVRHCAIRRKG